MLNFPAQYSVSQVNKLYSSNAWYIAVMSGFICIYTLNATTGNGSWDKSTCPYTLPEEYCPSISMTTPVVTGNGGSWTGYISISTAGQIIIGNYGNGGSSDKRRGFLMYPIGIQYSVSQSNTLVLYGAPGSASYIHIKRVGHTCILMWTISQSTNEYWGIEHVIPEGFRPDHTIYVPSCVTNANGYILNVCAYGYVNPSGTIGFQVASAISGGVNKGICSWYVN